MISESLYQFCLHYADNIAMRGYGSVEHEGYKITYLDTIPVILRVHKGKNEVQHNDELKKKGTDFIVFTLLWGFERKKFNEEFLFAGILSEENQVAHVDNMVLDFMLPRMKDKAKFLEDFGFPFERIEEHNEMRFSKFIAQLK